MPKTEFQYALVNLMWAVQRDCSEPTIQERSLAFEAAVRKLIVAEMVACKVLAQRDAMD